MNITGTKQTEVLDMASQVNMGEGVAWRPQWQLGNKQLNQTTPYCLLTIPFSSSHSSSSQSSSSVVKA